MSTTAKKKQVRAGLLNKDRMARAEKIARLIQNAPDWTRVDTSGFMSDAWHAFKSDVAEVWKKSKSPDTELEALPAEPVKRL